MSDEEGDEGNLQQDISVKINPIRRLCRDAEMTPREPERGGGGGGGGCGGGGEAGRRGGGGGGCRGGGEAGRRGGKATSMENNEPEDCVVACPLVLRQLCTQLRAQSSRGNRNSLSLPAIHNLLTCRPYWSRCLCSPTALPAITERELAPLLALTAAHRFLVIVVTNATDNLGSVVVGGESLIAAVYGAQNLPGLRPCLQSPSEPSLAFIKYHLSRPRTKKKERKAAPSTILNNGNVKVGMVLIYQKTQMLYAGFPLASYGCSKQDFLTFISKYTQTNFYLRIPETEQADRPESPDESDQEEILEEES